MGPVPAQEGPQLTPGPPEAPPPSHCKPTSLSQGGTELQERQPIWQTSTSEAQEQVLIREEQLWALNKCLSACGWSSPDNLHYCNLKGCLIEEHFGSKNVGPLRALEGTEILCC